MKKILEIGCGHGFMGSTLSKKTDYIGIDLDESNVSVARQRYPHVNYQIGNAEKLVFENNSFDDVYALDILEHVDDLDSTISEVSRVLKKDGKFYINVPYHKSEAWLLKIRPSYFEDIHHVRIIDPILFNSQLECKNLFLVKKSHQGFIQHFELYYLFKRKTHDKTQTSIGSWRDTPFTMFVHIFFLYFQPQILSTPLKFFPIWILTVPLGYLINLIGNRYFPKSVFMIYRKK